MNKTVMIGGYFDPLHSGHVAHILAASKLEDRLIIVLSRDDQCIKKKEYCFMTWNERATILRALKGVWAVVENIDSGTSMAKTIEKWLPDIFAKGGDRTPDNMPQEEIDICEKYGIKIVYGVGGEKTQSSSKLVENIKHG